MTVETATGAVQDAPPPGTQAYVDVLQSDPGTRGQVGKANAFVSHAWQYAFVPVIAALEAFVAANPAPAEEGGGGEWFFWFDCFVIDEHATQELPQEWWSTEFKQSIHSIGHTVMVLAPWDAPLPLTRAWCLCS